MFMYVPLYRASVICSIFVRVINRCWRRYYNRRPPQTATTAAIEQLLPQRSQWTQQHRRRLTRRPSSVTRAAQEGRRLASDNGADARTTPEAPHWPALPGRLCNAWRRFKRNDRRWRWRPSTFCWPVRGR